MLKLFLPALALIIVSVPANAQGGCTPQGNCQMGDPGVECYLQDQERYPSSDCPSTPGCPGIKDTDIYYCYQYDEPCGSVICTGCEECVSATPPGTHKAINREAHVKVLLARIRRRNAERSKRAA